MKISLEEFMKRIAKALGDFMFVRADGSNSESRFLLGKIMEEI